MQVRKFEAPTMQEAIKIVKQELGPDAIILSTKNNKKGFGLLSKASVEVTAAVTEKSLVKKQITERVVTPQTKEQIRNLPATKQSKIYNEFSDHYKSKAKAMQSKGKASESKYIDITDEPELSEQSYGDSHKQQSPASYGRNAKVSVNIDAIVDKYESRMNNEDWQSQGAPSVAQAPANDSHKVNSDLNIDSIKTDVQRLKNIVEELKSEQIALTDSKAVELGSDEVNEEFKSLLRNGVDRKYAASLMKQVTFSLPREYIHDSKKIIDAVAVEMMQNVRVENILGFKPGSEQRVFSFIGPTGVGKTTTIAKIASDAILTKNLRVGLINLDTYRIGASDQLATYAKILNAPFRYATNIEELERVISEFKPMDLILVDTTGRSQKDNENLVEMKKLLDGVNNSKSIMVLSSTTRDQELYDILNRFRIFKPHSLVFSKLDECTVYGCVYNIAVKTGLPLAYFTVGQRVPEDIETASPERVVDLILDI